jgi:hypothetical protein
LRRRSWHEASSGRRRALACGAFAQIAPLFTEDFESGAIDAKKWSVRIDGGIAEVQQQRAAHGRYSLHVSCPGPSQKLWAFLVANNLPEPLRKHHFERAYVYITPKLPARHTVFITAGTPGFPKYKYEEMATLNGKFLLTCVDQANGGEDWHSGGSDIPLDRWFLLEWEFSDDPNYATVWADAQEVYDTPFSFRHQGGNNLVGGFSEVAFGFRLWSAAPNAFDIYYDDVALDANRIGDVASERKR